MSNPGRVISRVLGWVMTRFGFALAVTVIAVASLGEPGWSTSRPLVALTDQLRVEAPVELDVLAPSSEPTVVDEEPAVPMVFGDDVHLDELWLECEAGSGLACDQLFIQSPVGSEYERFGVSCGERATVLDCHTELDEDSETTTDVVVTDWSKMS